MYADCLSFKNLILRGWVICIVFLYQELFVQNEQFNIKVIINFFFFLFFFCRYFFRFKSLKFFFCVNNFNKRLLNKLLLVNWVDLYSHSWK